MSFQLLKNFFFVQALLAAGYATFYLSLRAGVKREIGWRPWVAFSLTSAAAYLAPNLWILNACLFALVLLLARTREQIGLIVLVAFLSIPALNVGLRVGGALLLSYSAVTSLALGGLLGFLSKPRKARRRAVAMDLPSVLIAILLIFTGARGGGIIDWCRAIGTVAVGWGVPYYVITRSIGSSESARKAILWFAGAASMLAMVALYEMVSYWPLYSILNDKFGIPRGALELVVKLRFGLMRAEGPFLEATAFGFVLVFGLAAALAARSDFKDGLWSYVVPSLLAISLIAPQSRGGWLGAAVVLVAIALYLPARRSILLLGPLAAAFTYAVVKLSTADEGLAGSVSYRDRLFERGLGEFLKRPILGDTQSNVIRRMPDLVQGEGIVDFVNTYVYFALIGGIVGLSLLVLSFVLPTGWVWLNRSSLRSRMPSADLATFCFAITTSSAVMFVATSFNNRIGLILFVLIGLGGVLVRQRSVVPRPPADSSSPFPVKRDRLLGGG